MDEQDTFQDGGGCEEGMSNECIEDHCESKQQNTVNACNGDNDIKKKRLSRRKEKKRRKKEAKKRDEENKKRKLETEEEKNEQSTGESLSNKKLKKEENSNFNEGTEKPSVILTLKRQFNNSHLKKNPDARLKMKDIQDLILYSLLWHSSGVSPRWCEVHNRKMIKKVVVIALRSVGENDYLQNIEAFPYIHKEFNENVVKTQASGTDFFVHYAHDSLLNVPIPKSQLRKEMEKLKEENKDQEDDAKSKYLLTMKQLKVNEYPSKCYTSDTDNDDGYLPCVVKEAASSTVDEKASVFAIDCEMCSTSQGNELTRISIVDEMFNVVYDTLVMPNRPILDYKTKYSGITAERLEGVTVTLQDVQKEIQRILPHNAILAGHSFEFDLNALKMHHNRIIDTSVMFGDKRGSHFKPALRYLAHQLLGKNIQNNSDGHCSIEDAKTVMELVKQKFEKGPLFGQAEKHTEGLFHRMDREQRKTGKLTTAMIDYPSIVKFHKSSGNHVISRVSDSEIVSSAVTQIKACDFVWVHFHGAQHFYEGMANNDTNAKKEVLRNLDSRVSTVCQAIPEDCLTIIVMGYGDVSDIIRIQKDPKPRSDELRRIVSEAKKGLCFLKIT